MGRLSKRDENGNAYYDFGFLNSNHWAHGKHVDRLADYEDTGLEPEEIKDFMSRRKDAVELAGLCKEAGSDRLRELAEADRDGRLVELPCKVGDTVWRVIRHCTEIAFDDCVGCERNESGRCKPKFFEQAFSVGLYDQIGKTVFLTREAAVKALEAKKC